MPAPILLEQVLHVPEEFHMPALVAGDGNTLYIFLNGRLYDLKHTAVMPQVYDLGALTLHDPAHHINGGIMPVEKASGSNNPYLILNSESHGRSVRALPGHTGCSGKRSFYKNTNNAMETKRILLVL